MDFQFDTYCNGRWSFCFALIRYISQVRKEDVIYNSLTVAKVAHHQMWLRLGSRYTVNDDLLRDLNFQTWQAPQSIRLLKHNFKLLQAVYKIVTQSQDVSGQNIKLQEAKQLDCSYESQNTFVKPVRFVTNLLSLNKLLRDQFYLRCRVLVMF